MAGQPGRFVHFACSGSIAHLSGAEIIPRILWVMNTSAVAARTLQGMGR